MFILSVGIMTADSPLLALFIEVINNHFSYKLTKQSSTGFSGGLCELTSRLDGKRNC